MNRRQGATLAKVAFKLTPRNATLSIVTICYTNTTPIYTGQPSLSDRLQLSPTHNKIALFGQFQRCNQETGNAGLNGKIL